MNFISRSLLLLLLFPLFASAREVPIRDFFKDAEFTTVSLSPDGKHIAVSVPKADRTVRYTGKAVTVRRPRG